MRVFITKSLLTDIGRIGVWKDMVLALSTHSYVRSRLLELTRHALTMCQQLKIALFIQAAKSPQEIVAVGSSLN